MDESAHFHLDLDSADWDLDSAFDWDSVFAEGADLYFSFVVQMIALIDFVV